MKKVIGILGWGSMGIALAIILAPFYEVRIWVRDSKEAAKMRKKRENKKRAPGLIVPESVLISSDLAEIMKGVDLVIFAVPSIAIREVSTKLSEVLTGKKKGKLLSIVSVSKGMDGETLQIPSQIIEGILGKFGISYAHWSLPMFASEIVDGKSLRGVLASTNRNLAEEIRKILGKPSEGARKNQILLSRDLIGVQLGGTLKNILAIAIGVFNATEKDKKTRSRFVSLCAGELIRVGTGLGGEPATLKGLSGRGDLLSTVSSPLSRNLQLGIKLLTKEWPEIKKRVEERQLTSEGMSSVGAIYLLCRELQIEAPIIEQVYYVISGERSPDEGAANLIKLAKEKRG